MSSTGNFSTLKNIANQYYAVHGSPGNSMPYRNGPLDFNRYVILSGKTVHAFQEETNLIEEHIISRDMYFTEEDIIKSPRLDSSHIRVALNKGKWTWMDVDRIDVLRVELKPMAEITRSAGYSNQPNYISTMIPNVLSGTSAAASNKTTLTSSWTSNVPNQSTIKVDNKFKELLERFNAKLFNDDV